MKENDKDIDLEKKTNSDEIKKSEEDVKSEDKGSASMFDLEENPWGDEDYLGDTPYPHMG